MATLSLQALFGCKEFQMSHLRSLSFLTLFALAAAPLFAASSRVDVSVSASDGPGCPTPSGLCALPTTRSAPLVAQSGPGCPTPSGLCALPITRSAPLIAQSGPGCPTPSGLCALPTTRSAPLVAQSGPGCPTPSGCAFPSLASPVGLAPISARHRFDSSSV